MISRGFTFIELLVSVSILLLLAGLLVAGYNGFNSSQQVTQAAATVRNNLRAIRTAASSGVKPVGCDTLVGYMVNFSDNSSYASSVICSSGAVQNGSIISSYSLPNGIHFVPVPQTIIFYPIDRGASIAESIVIKGSSKTETISVSISGIID